MKKITIPLFMRSLVVIALLLAGVGKATAYDFMYNGLAYNLDGDGKSVYVTFTDSTNNFSSNYSTITNAVIPEVIALDGGVTYNVIAVDEKAFYKAPKLTSVTIPKSIKSLGEYAFADCPLLMNTYISSIESWCKMEFGEASVPFNVDGNLYVNGHLTTEIIIPNTINEIATCTFLQAPITSVSIPASVKKIGLYAFARCNKLEKVKISDLESWCIIDFSDCSSNPLYYAKNLYLNGSLVTNLSIPNSISEIKDFAFIKGSFSSLVVPDNVTHIGNGAFSSCKNLSSVSLGNQLKTIGSEDGTWDDWGVFVNCSSLTSITIPNTVTSIGALAFYKCEKLQSLKLSSSLSKINMGAFYKCTSLKSLVLPATLKTIGESAFNNCSGLTSLTIPEQITSIGSGAFRGCNSITQLTWNAIDLSTNGGFPTSNITKVTIGSSVKTLPSSFVAGSKITSVSIPSSVTTIGSSAFQGCTGLTSVSIPSSVTSIGVAAFKSCVNLKTFSLPSSLKSISDSMFYDCRSLTTANIPDNVNSIGSGAFYNCSALSSITIPENLTSLSNTAFSYCYITKLTWNAINLSSNGGIPAYKINNVTIGSKVQSLPDNFLKDSKITSLTLPASLTTIGSHTFYRCPNLTSLTIPENLTSIGDSAFYGCYNITQLTWNAINLSTNGDIPTSKITKVTIGNKVKTLPINFVQGSKITSIVIPDNVTIIGSSAFRNCADLYSLVLGKGVWGIYSDAFSNTGIVVARIPEQVASISTAFRNCSKLVKVYFEGELSYNSNSFYHSPIKVTIGKSSSCNVVLDPNSSFVVDGITYVITDMTNRKVKIVDIDETKCATDIEVKKVKFNNVEFTPTELGVAALAGNYTVKSFKFGDVTTIPYYAFYESSLSKAVIPNSITSIGQHAFENCKRMKEFVVGTGVNTIDQYVLAGCSVLRRVELGENVATINANSFNGCSKIKTLRVRRTTPPVATSGVFNDLDKWTCTLYVPTGTVDTYKNANEWKTFFFISDSETEPSEGDVNGDGKINVSDVTALVNMILGTIPKDEAAADVNGDGKVNVSDVTALVNIILGIS